MNIEIQRGFMVTIKLQKAIFHSQPRLEIDDQQLRFVSGIFTEPLEVPISSVCFVDQTMLEPNPEPVPAVIPRIPRLRTGSEATHKPNTCLIFSVPVQVPPVKRLQIGTVPFSVAKARTGEVWIDGFIIGCAHAGEAKWQLRANGIRPVSSVSVALAEIYGTANVAITPEPKALATREDFYSREPPRRGQ